jgi:hypothetical protein
MHSAQRGRRRQEAGPAMAPSLSSLVRVDRCERFGDIRVAGPYRRRTTAPPRTHSSRLGRPDDRVARIASGGPCPLDSSRLGSTSGRRQLSCQPAYRSNTGGLDRVAHEVFAQFPQSRGLYEQFVADPCQHECRARLRHRCETCCSPTLGSLGVADGPSGWWHRPARLLCRGCERRRSACWRPDPRRLASARRCRSPGPAVTRRRRPRYCG